MSSSAAILFGPFTLHPAERLLEKDGQPIRLGDRALDILIALTESPGVVVTKRDLIARVWSNVAVDDGSLRFHVATLRKALGDGQAGARYVTNVSGRGYCFVAAVTRAGASFELQAKDAAPAHNLPFRLMRMIGRDESLDTISDELGAHRFVTIVGSGGIGKTTVAVAVGHALLGHFSGAVRFVDLGSLTDPKLVPDGIASTLRLMLGADDPAQGLVAFLKDKRLALILDNCEHVIEVVATLAERIFQAAPQVYILATSREPLLAEGEYIHRMLPLDCPPDQADLTAEAVLKFPAAQLFVERAAASHGRFELNDDDASHVAKICRTLDGLALAIELAAGRVDAYGIQGIATLLETTTELVGQGRRTALPRHKTLSATLDWSYNLLTDVDRAVFRRLGIFVGFFSLTAAQAVVSGEDVKPPEVVEALARLMMKSLVSRSGDGGESRYRLLETTRSYARAKLEERGELGRISERHAQFQRDVLERQSSQPTPDGQTLVDDESAISNVRVALEWCFSGKGRRDIGVALTAASTTLFLKLSLISECLRWTKEAIASLDEKTLGTNLEVGLQTVYGFALIFSIGNSDQVKAAFERGLTIAETIGALHSQRGLLSGLHVERMVVGDYKGALAFAQRAEALAEKMDDPIGLDVAHWALGASYHMIGEQRSARKYGESAIDPSPASRSAIGREFLFDHHNSGLCGLARSLWLLGYSAQAAKLALQIVQEAEATKHPFTICIAITWTVHAFLWSGDWQTSELMIERLHAHANEYSLAPYQGVSVGLKGELSIGRGAPQDGIRRLDEWFKLLPANRFVIHNSGFLSTLAEGLALTGDFGKALEAIDAAFDDVFDHQETYHLPELLRIKGTILEALHPADPAKAEDWYSQSLEAARRQGAIAWELRTAICLARLRRRQGRMQVARSILEPVYSRFTEGFDTANLKAAKLLLDEIEA